MVVFSAVSFHRRRHRHMLRLRCESYLMRHVWWKSLYLSLETLKNYSLISEVRFPELTRWCFVPPHLRAMIWSTVWLHELVIAGSLQWSSRNRGSLCHLGMCQRASVGHGKDELWSLTIAPTPSGMVIQAANIFSSLCCFAIHIWRPSLWLDIPHGVPQPKGVKIHKPKVQ
jgi:hypothetical protein